MVRSVSRPSSPTATLGTGGWLGLTRQGLSPCKKRQASLGALTRWRQLAAETSPKIGAFSRDIADINRSIYENNARSKEYLDYQRTRYIRGEQDWISRTEGRTIYRSDSWGLQNLTTGSYVAEGDPFNYTHFTGQGFKGDLVPIDNRALYEQVYGRRNP